MRDYGKVHTSFWTSETIRSMSEDARSLAIYLLTCPHNTIAGVFRLPDGYICDDMQWTSERVANAFAETVAKGFANRCETTKWVWINKHLEWNPPENPNQRKSAAKIATSVPDQCGWKADFMRLYADSMDIPMEPFGNPFETLSKPGAVTGTGTEESHTPPAAVPAAGSKKGTRLTAEWELPEEWGRWAEQERRLKPAQVLSIADRFKDFWISKAGKDACKLDWQATWRNWVRNERATQ